LLLSSLLLDLLLPGLSVLSVEAIRMTDTAIELQITSTQPTVSCPHCAEPYRQRGHPWLAARTYTSKCLP